MANDLIEAYAADALGRGLAKKTITVYTGNIRKFLEFAEKRKKAITKINKLDLRDYVVKMREEHGFTESTLRYNLAAISSLYDFLLFEGKVRFNPTIEVRKRYLSAYKNDGEKHTHKIISIPDAAKMIQNSFDIRDKAMLMVFFKTGIRRGELLSLDIDDVDLKDGSILLKPTKKRTNRRVYFDSECARYLSRWIEIRKERAETSCKALFVSSPTQRVSEFMCYTIITKAASRARLHDKNSDRMEDHFSPHACRHWFTTHLLDSGMRRDYVQELRGDRRGSAIDIYTHIDPKLLKESYLAHIPNLGV
ncbi:MAG: tyrosine-type recombinase/integrase [Methanotrichaceae archaeon]|nr:tyrosine-type recombinase/integrase [Methanotrichaceae archaeon]